MTEPQTFGVGEWRTRNGQRVIVGWVIEGREYPLEGFIGEGRYTWTGSGKHIFAQTDPLDLIAPWVEPAPVPPKSRGDTPASEMTIRERFAIDLYSARISKLASFYEEEVCETAVKRADALLQELEAA